MEAPVAVRCRIEEVFTRSFIDLVAMAPQNCIVRGLILALTRKMPPEECQSFDQVKAWVEANCEKRFGKVQHGANPAISIDVEFWDKESGRASYSVDRTGHDTFELDAMEVLEIAQDSVAEGRKLDAMVESLAAKITNDAWDRCSPCMDNEDSDYEYSDHDGQDIEKGRVRFARPALKAELLRFLGEHHPDLLEELQ
jgi:hypothetical protein